MNLSPEQEAAVSATGSRVIVIAGPGSGKSRCLVERAKRCQNPLNTVIVTFTNAGANEVRERLDADGYHASRFRYIGTLHSWALTELAKLDTLPAILGDADKEQAIADTFKKLGAMARNMSKKEAWEYAVLPPAFGNGKAVGLAIRTWLDHAGTHIDFVLGDFHACLDSVTPPDEILVDEYQDSALIDSAIYEYFSHAGSTLWKVGDVRQSVFGFRGARPDIMRQENLVPETQVYQLKTNYRSVPSICRYATKLGSMMQGMEHLDPEIVSSKGDNNWKPLVYHFDSEEEEALEIANTLQTSIVDSSVAIICRYNDQVRKVSQILRAKGITLTASTDKTMDTESSSWVQKIVERMRNVTSGDAVYFNTLQQDTWAKFLTGIGVPFATQESLLPRLMQCNSVAEVACIGDEESVLPESKVTVSTIHGVKGLEFDYVWVIGCDDATFTPADEESLRLFFVAVTRARYFLTLSWSKSRVQPGSGKRITVAASQYLKYI